jgi:hypothetical protein
MGPTKRGTLKIEHLSQTILRHNFLIQSVIQNYAVIGLFISICLFKFGQRYSFGQGGSYILAEENKQVLFIGLV